MGSYHLKGAGFSFRMMKKFEEVSFLPVSPELNSSLSVSLAFILHTLEDQVEPS